MNKTSIWKTTPSLEALKSLCRNTMVEHLDIQFTEISADSLAATMPVDNTTCQPHGLLHGGASAALAETLGSVAANLCVDRAEAICVGLEINANHIRAARDGLVTGRATPVHIGATTQVWEIRITDAAGRLVCVSRLTMAVLRNKNRKNQPE